MTGSITARMNHTSNTANTQAAIWIIDDNAQFSDALASYIGQITNSRRITCFASADEAISRLDSGIDPPGVMLLDVDMPGMNGLDAIPVLKQKAPEGKIYMVTGTESAQRRRVALERGAEDYLLKLDLSKERLLKIIG